jgi:hypothetical protein
VLSALTLLSSLFLSTKVALRSWRVPVCVSCI